MSEQLVEVAALRPHPQASIVPAPTAADYQLLCADIEARGLLEPLSVAVEGVVLDGHQRLRAARQLGLERVPVRIVAPEDELEFILLAALQRRHLSPSQRAAIAVERARYQQLANAGRARQHANLRQNAEVAALPPRGARTRELAAGWAGCSARTVQDAATVAAHDPELFARVKNGALGAEAAARQVRRAIRDRALPQPPPLPVGPFSLIYADPPWQLGNPHGVYAPENHYPTLSLEQLQALAVPAAEQAVLFLWAVNSLLPEALELIKAWGFEYRSNLVWVKESIGTGRWLRQRHELLLIAIRGGQPAPDRPDLTDSVLEARRGRHSEKPAAAYELIERMYPTAGKLELFARGSARPGWASWGNEATP